LSQDNLTPPENLKQPMGLRILLVEDDTDAAATMAALLGFYGHDVEIVGDGPNALRMAEIKPPDVVLLDIGLPGMDGYEVARRLRQRRTKRILLIAISGYGREAPERLSSYEAGIDLHLTKPVPAEELASFLARFQAVAPPRAH
jgi:two-component system, sensor histidine kinase